MADESGPMEDMQRAAGGRSPDGTAVAYTRLLFWSGPQDRQGRVGCHL